MRLWCCCAFALCAHAAEVDYAMKLQQTLGSASIAYKEANFDGALSKLEQLEQTIQAWRAAVVAKKAAGAAPVEPEKEPKPPGESIEFSMNQTHVPDKCKRQAEEGATMRVHYVGKLLTGSKKMFASSFHTGSTPFKFKLGSSDVVDAWNRGLLGMCEGVRLVRARPHDACVAAQQLRRTGGRAAAACGTARCARDVRRWQGRRVTLWEAPP